MKNILEIKKISKSFKSRVVVKEVSFTIKEGEVIGLLGPNGAGKTTSFYMVVGIIPPDTGNVLLNNESITNLAMYQRARIGISYLPQEPSIFRNLNVTENIMISLEAQKLSKIRRRERLEELIEEFHIGYIRKSKGYALSGGERRRVEIARALAGSPKFLLLDEPFAGIDPIAVNDIQEIIIKLKNMKIGILITDHNVRETLGICDYANILKDGRIQVKGAPEEIVKSDIAKKFYLGENFQL